MGMIEKRMVVGKKLIEKLNERESVLKGTCMDFFMEENDPERLQEMKRVAKISKEIKLLLKELRQHFPSEKQSVIDKLTDNELAFLTMMFAKNYTKRLPVRFDSRWLGEFLLAGKVEDLPPLLSSFKDGMMSVFCRFDYMHSARESYVIDGNMERICDFFLKDKID